MLSESWPIHSTEHRSFGFDFPKTEHIVHSEWLFWYERYVSLCARNAFLLPSQRILYLNSTNMRTISQATLSHSIELIDLRDKNTVGHSGITRENRMYLPLEGNGTEWNDHNKAPFGFHLFQLNKMKCLISSQRNGTQHRHTDRRQFVAQWNVCDI